MIRVKIIMRAKFTSSAGMHVNQTKKSTDRMPDTKSLAKYMKSRLTYELSTATVYPVKT